jgi:hypothetical protein
MLGYFDGRTITVKPPVDLGLTMEEWLDYPAHPLRGFLAWCTHNLSTIEKVLPWGRLLLLTKDFRARPAITGLLDEIKLIDFKQVATIVGNPLTTFAPNLNPDPWPKGPKGPSEKKLVNLAERNPDGTRKYNKDNPYMPPTIPYEFGQYVRGEYSYLDVDSVRDPSPPFLEPVWCRLPVDGGLDLARIVSLYEPAGKVRTIVMFDWVSQHVLLPIHDLLFKFLKDIPSDATFDQDRGLKSFADKGYKYVASYDLKAATESISMVLYRILLTPILGGEITDAWADLLQDRDVAISKDASRYRWGTHVRYRRGQPMGALSSWACMSLLHHAIVQYCAYSIQWGGFENKFKWFNDYLVLGDDIVIADEGVADRYLVVCKALGISIGLPKSFESMEGFINFAGQSYLASENLSPISFKEEISARSPGTRIEMGLRLIRRGHISLTSTGWLGSLLRSVLPESVYKQTLGYLKSGKGIHYAVRTVLMTVCAQLDQFPIPNLLNKESSTGIEHNLSVFGYAALVGGGASLFSESLEAFLHRALKKDSPRLNEIVLAIVLLKAKTVQSRFLLIQPIYDHWKTDAVFGLDGSITNPELFLPRATSFLRPILKRYTSFGKKLALLLEWEETYYSIILKIISLHSRPGMTIESFELALSTPLEVLWGFLLDAERMLPIKPEQVLGEQTKARVADFDDIYHQASARYAVWENILHMGSASDRFPELSFSGTWSEEDQIFTKTN